MFTQKAQFSLLEILLPSTVLHLDVLVILAPCVCVCVPVLLYGTVHVMLCVYMYSHSTFLTVDHYTAHLI